MAAGIRAWGRLRVRVALSRRRVILPLLLDGAINQCKLIDNARRQRVALPFFLPIAEQRTRNAFKLCCGSCRGSRRRRGNTD